MGKTGLITDDMTGTMTCGVLLAQKGIKACSFFSKDDLEGAKDQDALILSANSRNLKPEHAKKNVKEAYQALKQQGAEYFTKRIDTTFRGGIGYEIDALLEEMPEDTIAIAAAAMPDTRRILVGGYSIIDGTILTETGAARDVLSPIKEAHIPTLLRSQSRYPVGEIPLKYVLDEEEKLMEKLRECRNAGHKILVVDGISHQHLEKTASAVHRLGWNIVCVDPGAFTQKMALCRGIGDPNRSGYLPKESPDIHQYKEKLLIVAGSATEVTKKQLHRLAQKDYCQIVSIDAEQLAKGGETANTEIARGISLCRQAIGNGNAKVIALETAAYGARLNLKDIERDWGLNTGEASANINIGLGKIAESAANTLFDSGILGGIYMTGGDTLVSVLKSLGASGIRLVDTVQPQTNLGILIGGKLNGTNIVGKGGLIGPDDTIIRVAERLYDELSRRGDL